MLTYIIITLLIASILSILMNITFWTWMRVHKRGLHGIPDSLFIVFAYNQTTISPTIKTITAFVGAVYVFFLIGETFK